MTRPQIQLLPPRAVLTRGRVDDDFAVGYDSFHVDITRAGLLGGPDEEVLDVVVGAAEAEESIWSEERLICCLR